MSFANRPLPRWLAPVLLAILAADLTVGVILHRTVPTLLLVASIVIPTVIALDSVGSAGKRRLRAEVQPARVFSVVLDPATAHRLSDLGEGALTHERELLVADATALELWTEESVPKRVLVIPWERLAGATVEFHDLGKLHTVSLGVPGAHPLTLDVVRPLHERLRHRAATAAELAAEVESLIPSDRVGKRRT